MIERPASMRAARLHAWGDVRLETLPVPRPAAGEVLVRIEACGVCGSDALRWYVERKAPVVLGHEPAGTIVETGRDVDGLRAGDRVFVHHHAPCGQCPECARALWSNCAVWRTTALDPGGFTQFARVPAPNVRADTLLLPADMDFDTATFIEPVACCIRALRRQACLRDSDDLCIIGLGSMGLLLVQLARVFGARRIFGSDFLPERRALAVELGAQAVFDPGAHDVAAQVRNATGGRGADVVIVCPGDARALQSGLDVAAAGARVIGFTPLPPDARLEIDAASLYFREVTLSHSYSCGPDETRAALQLLGEHRLDVLSLVTHRAGLDGVAAAIERAAGKGTGLKTIIHPWA